MKSLANLIRAKFLFPSFVLFLAIYVGAETKLSASTATVTLSGTGITNAVANVAPVVIDPGITVTSTDNTAWITSALIDVGTGFQSGDILGVTVPSGITYSFSSVTGILTVTGAGTPAAYQAIFRSAVFSTTSNVAGSRAIIFSVGAATANPSNGHYYQYVSAPGLTWDAARTAASQSYYQGMQGYLATPRNATENNFIVQKLSGAAWIGFAALTTVPYTGTSNLNTNWTTAGGTTVPAGTLEADGTTLSSSVNYPTGRVWFFATGPQAGMPLDNNTSSGSNTPIGGAYNHWNAGEPNNAGGEPCAEMYAGVGGSAGYWNDLSNTNAPGGYVIEYGGMPGDSPQLGTVTLRIAVGLSQVSTLSNLTASGGATLSPVFNTNTLNYTYTPGSNLSSITVTPTVTNANATIAVNGSAVTSGQASQSIILVAGTNVINIVVTAQDGFTQTTYTYTINNPGNPPRITSITPTTASAGTVMTIVGTGFSASRSSSSVDGIILYHEFGNGTATPTGGLGSYNGLGSFTIVDDSHITFTVPISTTAGVTSVALQLSGGSTVYSDPNFNASGYTFTYNLPSPSTDATLSSLTTSVGTLSPTFISATTAYTLSVANGVTSLNVTPTVHQSNALVTVNGALVNSGVSSNAIALNVGTNVINVLVAAQSGATINYTITVTRAAPPVPPSIAGAISISNTTQTYTGKPLGVTTSISPASVNSEVIYYPGFTVPTEAGTYYVLANILDNTYYGSQTAVFTILPAAQTVTIASPANLRVGVATQLNATSTSNGPITYAVVSGNATINGSTLTAKDTNPIVIQATQAGTNDYLAGSATITVTALAYAPIVVTSNPSNQLVRSGNTATFTVNISGQSPTYQWKLNGVPIQGATLATYTVSASAANVGSYTCTIGNDAGSVTTAAATLTLNTTRLTNLSARAVIGAANFTVGFVESGTSSKSILLRGDGPSLANYGVTSPLSSPSLTLYNSSGSTLASNTAWGGGAALSALFSQLGAFPFASTSSDTAINQSISAGSYTAIVSGANNSTGATMVEIYDADPLNAPSRIVNLSARGLVGTGASSITSGFVVSGNSTETLLIRAIGPTLATYGISGVLAQPTLTVYDSKGNAIASNTVWGGSSALSQAMTQVGAFNLTSTSADSAVLVTLPAGSYTVQVSGVNGATGNALVEIYEVSSP